MTRAPRRRFAAALAVAAACALGAGVVAVGGACNAVLGIEENAARPIDAGDDADAGGPDEAGPDAASERCTLDTDCTPPNGCYTPHCDTILGACTYTLCATPGKACSAGACDQTSFVCTGATDYGFRAAAYDVPGVAIGCGGKIGACVAAVYPYVILGTTGPPAALRVDDLVAKSASVVAIAGAGTSVRPGLVVASGRRVWIVGDVQGTAPPYQLPIAWIDVPSDPTAPLVASTSVLSYPFPSASAFAAPNGALYLVDPDVAAGFPTAVLTAPLGASESAAVVNADADGGAPAPGDPAPSIPMYRLGTAPPGSVVAAASGPRLVLYRPNVANLVTSPGSADVAVGADVALSPALTPLGPARFAAGPDGVVAMTQPDQIIPSPNDCNCTTQEVARWLLPNTVATTFDQNLVAGYETYVNPYVDAGPASCNVNCPSGYFAQPSLVAWLDANDVLLTAPAGENRLVPATRLLQRSPLGGVANRRIVDSPDASPAGTFGVDELALVSSNGFGYLVVADSEGNAVRLSIFAPTCDTK